MKQKPSPNESSSHVPRVTEADVKKTAFTSPTGRFVFLAATLGLTNLASQISKMTAITVQAVVGHFASANRDDIVIYSKTEKEHWRYLLETFGSLR